MTKPGAMADKHTVEDKPSRRVIGPWGAMAIVAGSMIGIGIFLTPPVVAKASPAPWAFYACWLLGAAMAMAGATAYAELGATHPEAGGDYAFLRRAFGPATAFAAGWVLFVGIFGGSLATMAVAVCQYQLDALLAAAGLAAPGALSRKLVADISGAQLLAIGLLVALTALNAWGTRLSTVVQIVMTMIPFVIFGIAALWGIAAAPPEWAAPSQVQSLSVRGYAAAIAAVYFAYAGWNAVAYVAGEVRQPGRNIPLGLLGGTAAVTLLYVLLCAGFLAVLGLGGLAQTFEAGSAAAAKLGGDTAVLGFTGCVAVALIGSVNATVLAGARIAHAMAQDGILPRPIAQLSVRGTPARPLWLQLGVGVVLLLTGTFEKLLEMTSLTMMLLATLTIGAMWRLRQLEPDALRPYRATGHPCVPGFFVLMSVGIIAVRIWEVVAPSDPQASWIQRMLPVLGLGLFVSLLGVGVWSRRKGKATT